MHGVTSRDPAAIDDAGSGPAFYTVKRIDGEVVMPRADAVNSIACFGDATTAQTDPDRLAVTRSGIRASADRPEFQWDWICPTDPRYRDDLLSVVDDCVDASPDLRLNTAGFPREQFCHCEHCDSRFEEWVEHRSTDASSGECDVPREHRNANSDREGAVSRRDPRDTAFDDRTEWRTRTITSFVETVRERVPGDLYLTVHPDPYPGQLARRRGLDLDALDDVVDGFVVPLCATTYQTTYWMEIIARGFDAAVDTPLTVQLSVTDDPDEVDAAVAAVTPHADQVVFGGDSDALEPVLARE